MALVGGEKPQPKVEQPPQGEDNKNVLKVLREKPAAWAMGVIAAGSAVVAFNLGRGETRPEGTTITTTVESPDGSVREESTFLPVNPEGVEEEKPPTEASSEAPQMVGDGIELGMNKDKPFKNHEQVMDILSQQIEKLNTTPRSELEDEEWWSQNAFIGTVIVRTTDIFEEEDYFMRLDNPVTIQVDGFLAWAAWNENTGMWATVDIGEENKHDDGTSIWKSTIEEDELWQSSTMEDAPLWTVATPSLDGFSENGSLSFRYYDSREQANETYTPTFSVYQSYEKAKAGLTESFHNGETFMPDSVSHINK